MPDKQAHFALRALQKLCPDRRENPQGELNSCLSAFAAALIDHLAGNQEKILYLYLPDKQLQLSASKWTIRESGMEMEMGMKIRGQYS